MEGGVVGGEVVALLEGLVEGLGVLALLQDGGGDGDILEGRGVGVDL